MQIAIIIPVYNHLHLTKQTLYDLAIALKDVDSFFQPVIIDDGSSDGTFEWVLKNYPKIHILKGDGHLWWSGAVNLGARYAIETLESDYILLWNNDIVFDNIYFQNILNVIKKYGSDTIIGSQIYVAGQDNMTWSLGGYFDPYSGKHGMAGYFKKTHESLGNVIDADWLTGMGTIIPKKIIEDLNYWDYDNFPQYYGDSDFTYRAKLKGYKIFVHPELRIFNKVEYSGIGHSGSFRNLLRLMTDNRSKINIKRNFKWYKLYAKSYRAFIYFFWRYCLIFGGFFKWKTLGFFGIRKESKY